MRADGHGQLPPPCWASVEDESPSLHPTGQEKKMTMAIPLPLLKKVKLDGHGLGWWRQRPHPFTSQEEKGKGHGHLPTFLLGRWDGDDIDHTHFIAQEEED